MTEGEGTLSLWSSHPRSHCFTNKLFLSPKTQRRKGKRGKRGRGKHSGLREQQTPTPTEEAAVETGRQSGLLSHRCGCCFSVEQGLQGGEKLVVPVSEAGEGEEDGGIFLPFIRLIASLGGNTL